MNKQVTKAQIKATDYGYIEQFAKADYKEIESFAVPNRHGKYPAITYEQRQRIMNFTRKLIDNFLNFVHAKV